MSIDPSYTPHFYDRQAALKEGFVMQEMEWINNLYIFLFFVLSKLSDHNILSVWFNY